MVLPWSEQIKFIVNLARRRLLKQKIPPYIPDFKKAFQHFCIHAGADLSCCLFAYAQTFARDSLARWTCLLIRHLYLCLCLCCWL
jgi:hypothetical protein